MKNKYEIRGDVTAIFFKQGKAVCETLIDTEDLARFLNIRNTLTAHSRGYVAFKVQHNKVNTMYLIHRLIMDAPEGICVDHISGNKLDNRKSNLRLANYSENNQNRHKLRSNNTSGLSGIYYSNDRQKWVATLRINSKDIYLGRYLSLSTAIKAREEAVLKYHPYANPHTDHYKEAV